MARFKSLRACARAGLCEAILNETSISDFGSPEQWQAVTTQRWLDRFSADADGADVYVLDGQTRPSFVRSPAERVGLAFARVVLLDCASAVGQARLAGPRRQPELANAQMDRWRAYLRGQADAMNLPVIDTTATSIAGAADALVALIEAVRTERQTAAEQAHRADALTRAAHPPRSTYEEMKQP
jgi:hypothetical protein